MDKLVYTVYAMFARGGMSTGMILFCAGCALILIALIWAVLTAATGRSRKRRMEKKMHERYQ